MTHQRPTHVRYLILAAATLMSFLLYLDRFCVSFAEDYIRQDLGLTQTQMDWFTSAFFWSYALAQVPSGWLSDRFGARAILAAYILAWSVFTGWIGAATGFGVLMIARLGCGLGQAGAYPTAAGVVRRWMPLRERGTASSFVANGGRVGAALAPILTAFLIVSFVPDNTPLEFATADVLSVPNVTKHFKDNAAAKSLLTKLDENRQKQIAGWIEQPETADAVPLCVALNDLLEQPALYDGPSMATLKLPREALHRLQRQTAGETLPTTELRRLNRFIIEGVFPRDLRKLYRLGWRPVLFLYGAAGLLVAGLFWWKFREQPELHPDVNASEVELINLGRPAQTPTSEQVPPLKLSAFVFSLNMWCNSIMQFGTNIGWLFLLTGLPRYLLDVHQVPIIERGYMTMLPPLVGIVGLFCGGKLSDMWTPKLGLKWGRRLPILVSRSTAILAYVGCIDWFARSGEPCSFSPWWIVALCSVVAFSTDFGVAPTWAFTQDIGGRHTGSVLGWGNMWGNIGAALAPIIYGTILSDKPTLGDWNMMFGVCAGAFLLSGLCAFAIDATKPLIEEGSGPSAVL